MPEPPGNPGMGLLLLWPPFRQLGAPHSRYHRCVAPAWELEWELLGGR